MDINKKANFQFIVDLILDDLTKESHAGLKMQRLNSGYYNSEYVKKISSLLNHEKANFPSKSNLNSNKFLRKIKSFISSENKFAFFKNKIPFFVKLQDPRKTGYAHNWMQDELQFIYALEDAGFNDIKR